MTSAFVGRAGAVWTQHGISPRRDPAESHMFSFSRALLIHHADDIHTTRHTQTVVLLVDPVTLCGFHGHGLSPSKRQINGNDCEVQDTN